MAEQLETSLLVAPDIPEKKLRAARRHFEIPSHDCIHAIIDCSLLGNTKSGAVLCSNQIYLRNGIHAGSSRGKHALPWQALDDQPELDDYGRVWCHKDHDLFLDVNGILPDDRPAAADLLASCREIVVRLTHQRDHVACQHCHQEIKRAGLDKHFAICVAKPVPCRHCGEEIQRRHLTEHETKCSSNVSHCKHCNAVFHAEELAAHEMTCDPEARGKEGYLSWGCPFCDKPPRESAPLRPNHQFSCCNTRWTVENVDRQSRTAFLLDQTHAIPGGGHDGYLISDCPHCGGRYSRCRFPIGRSKDQVLSHCRKCGFTKVFGPGISTEIPVAPYFGGQRPFARFDAYGVDFEL